MIAFFVNKDAKIFLIACFASETVGRLSIFDWALSYQYGAYMHMLWGLIYCSALTCYMLYKEPNKFVLTFVSVYVFFQIIMSLDCRWCQGNETFLYNNYKYIVTFLHCCIVSSFIKWGCFITFMDEFIAGFLYKLGFDGDLLSIWYNNKKHITRLY